MNTHSALHGLWLPLITPFRDSVLDEASLRRLVGHYAAQPVDGFILGATTGVGMALDEAETQLLLAVTRDALEAAGRDIPIYLGLSGADTRKLGKALDQSVAWGMEGYLIACPYYTRPSQEGLFQHFSALAEATDRPILIYNIPYRTGINMGNDTMLRLAELPNIVGVKDCCADPAQTLDLIRHRPADFTVLTGEDPHFYSALTSGADGAILASAHVHTAGFAGIRNKLLAGDQPGALADWQRLVDIPRLLFSEPSPGAIKHWLWRSGLIDSPEMRLPMVTVSAGLAERIERAMGAP
jgi:4-hydroxy-tetrahydrodipicolinate synthase